LISDVVELLKMEGNHMTHTIRLTAFVIITSMITPSIAHCAAPGLWEETLPQEVPQRVEQEKERQKWWERYKEYLLGAGSIVLATAIAAFLLQKGEGIRPHKPKEPKPLPPERLNRLGQREVDSLIAQFGKGSGFDGKLFEGEPGHGVGQASVEKKLFENVSFSEDRSIDPADGKIKTFSLGDQEFENVHFIQLPVLSQITTIPDLQHTNYCGIYALYNAHLLKELVREDPDIFQTIVDATGIRPPAQFLNRAAFTEIFEKSLTFIRKKRLENFDKAKTSPEKYLKRIRLAPAYVKNVSQLSGEEIGLLKEHLGYADVEDTGIWQQNIHMYLAARPVVWTMIKALLMDNKDNQTTPFEAFVGATSPKGSHWITLGHKKKDGITYLIFTDSVNRKRVDLFEGEFVPSENVDMFNELLRLSWQVQKKSQDDYNRMFGAGGAIGSIFQLSQDKERIKKLDTAKLKQLLEETKEFLQETEKTP